MEEPADGKRKRKRPSSARKAEGGGLTKLYKLRQLQKLIANGGSVFDLQDYCVNEWRMSANNARKYTNEAYQGLPENYEALDKRVIAFLLLARLETAFKLARADRNPAAMVAALKELADRFYKLAPDGTAVVAQPQEKEAGLDPEEDF